MEEVEYKDNEKVLDKITVKLKLPQKEPEDVECFVTRKHVIIESEEPIKISVLKIKDFQVQTSTKAQYMTYPFRDQQPLSGTATLTFLDDLNQKRKLALEAAAGSLYGFKTTIKIIKEEDWKPIDDLLGNLENIGLQVELVDIVTVKLTGQNIDEIRLRYQSELGGPAGGRTRTYLAGLIYIVKLETLQESRDLTAETDTYGRSDALGSKWIGGELAFRLNEDTELANLLTKAKETDIHVKVKKKPQRVEILGGREDFPETTRESLDVFNRIAKHVREVARDISTTSGVTRGERRVVRGSISRRVIYATLGGAAAGCIIGIIMVIISAVKGDLSIGRFIFIGIMILGLTVLTGLWVFLSLSIKRLRGRF